MFFWLLCCFILSFFVTVAVAAPLEMRRSMEVKQGILPKSTPKISFFSHVGGPHFDIGYLWSKDFARSPHVTPLKMWLLRTSTAVWLLSAAGLLLVGFILPLLAG